MEVWRAVAAQPKYEVSNKGRVRRITTGRILKQRLQSNGYPRVNLNGKDTYLVHRLVAVAFLKPDPARPTVNHLNGKKLDNCDTNLVWSTLIENNAHSAHKRHAATNPKRAMKLTIAKVRQIRKAHARGELSSAIAKQQDISPAMVRNIVYKRSWNIPIPS